MKRLRQMTRMGESGLGRDSTDRKFSLGKQTLGALNTEAHQEAMGRQACRQSELSSEVHRRQSCDTSQFGECDSMRDVGDDVFLNSLKEVTRKGARTSMAELVLTAVAGLTQPRDQGEADAFREEHSIICRTPLCFKETSCQLLHDGINPEIDTSRQLAPCLKLRRKLHIACFLQQRYRGEDVADLYGTSKNSSQLIIRMSDKYGPGSTSVSSTCLMFTNAPRRERLR